VQPSSLDAVRMGGGSYREREGSKTGAEWEELDRQIWTCKAGPTTAFGPRSRQRPELLPILTPAYPSMNSTFNINESTQRILLQELERGQRISSRLELSTGSSMEFWAELIEPTDFFTRYKQFVRVDIVAESEENHRGWKGLAESQLRMFVDCLEGGLPRRSPLHAHIFPQGFNWGCVWQQGIGWPDHITDPPSSQWCDTFFIGVESKPNASLEDRAEPVEMGFHADRFKQGLVDKAMKGGYYTDDMKVEISMVRKATELPQFLPDLQKLLKVTNKVWSLSLALLFVPCRKTRVP
jgi:hypothetical protein